MLPALIESDAEGIGGSGFVECIREHIHSVYSISKTSHFVLCLWFPDSELTPTQKIIIKGWTCQLTEEQFIAVKELVC